ncbi:MAG: transglycosylase domain-containing protein [Dehalococcoidia bacterium]
MSAGELVRRRVRRRLRLQQARRNVIETKSTSVFLALFFVTVITGSAIAAGAMVTTDRYDEYASVVQDADNVIAHLPRGGSRVYDRHGTLLYEFSNSGLRRSVPLSEVSRFMIDATVATEDASFWENNGINTRGLMRAAIENTPLRKGWLGGTGGSSISQQLAKNIFIPQAERTDRTIARKLKESAIAIELNRQFSKEQILEWYLNSISYGGVYIGVEAAAQGYFGKPARELTLSEASLLAGIPQQPSAYSPVSQPEAAIARQQEVLRLMVEHGAITPEQADEARQQPPQVIEKPPVGIQAPHFIFGPVAAEIEQRFGPTALHEGGLEIVTTLDLPLQQEAQRILEKWILEYEAVSNGHNGALNALDPRTGEVLVYIGSRDYFREDIGGENDMNRALRSPGSTLKPFTYLTAFQRGWSPSTGVLDVPLKLKDGATGEDYEVRNPIKGSYQGVIPAAQALGNSLNVPAVNTVLFAGIDNMVTTLRKAGFTTIDTRPNAYGPAITVGGVNVTLSDLVYGYSVLAANGVRNGVDNEAGRTDPDRGLDPAAILKVTDSTSGEVLYEYQEPESEEVFASSFPYLISSILSDGKNQCITFGVCGALALPDGRPAAIKTGTSEPFEDRTDLIGDTWAVGYTPQLVAGTWFGNSDNTPMANIFSTSVSWQTWREFMAFALDYLELQPEGFARPDSVVERDVCFPSGKLATSLCPRQFRQKGLFAAETLQGPNQIALTDDWWQPGFGGARLVLPTQLQTWSGLGGWLARNGLGGGSRSPTPTPTAAPRPTVAPTGPQTPPTVQPAAPQPTAQPVTPPPTTTESNAPTEEAQRPPSFGPQNPGRGQNQGSVGN